MDEIGFIEVMAGIAAIYGCVFGFIFFMCEYGWIFGSKEQRIEHKIEVLLKEREDIYWFKKFDCNPAFVSKGMLEVNMKEFERRIQNNSEQLDKLKAELEQIRVKA